MKTISSRFLNGALAILLVVVMLFGSTITGFAATVDKAETKGNHTGGYVYFIKPSTWSNVALIVGHDSWFQTYKMTKLSGNLYYVNLKSAAGGSWDGWNGWGFVDSSTTTNGGTKVWNKYNTYTHYTNLNTSYWLTDGKTEVCTPSSSDNNASFSINRPSSYTGLNFSQTVYSQLSGSSTTNAACGTITLNSYALTGNGTGSSATVTKSTSETSKSRSAANGTTVTLTATAASGYKFVGWFTSATATTATSTSATYTYTCTGSAKEFYARFQEDAKTYTVTYNANGGSGAPAAGSVKEGNTFTVSSTKPTKTGHTFKNWNTAADGSGTPYDSGATISNVKSDITLYAQYDTNTYTVKYDVGDGTGTFADQTKTHGVSINLHDDAPTPPDNKYIFSGWSDGNGKVYQPGDLYEVNADVTLTAQYTKNVFTATFVDRDDNVIGTPQEVNKDDTPKAPNPPEIDGYYFDGWSPEVGPMTGDMTFKATYTPINYNIELYANGGTLPSDSPTTYTIEDEITLPTPTYGNNIFDGWEDSSGNIVTKITKGNTGDKSFTAQWTMTYAVKVNNYVNRVHDQNGNYGGKVYVNDSTSPVYLESGASVTFKAVPKSTNYVFKGWYSDADFTNVVSNEETYTTEMTDADVTLYALFVKKFYLTTSADEQIEEFEYNIADNTYSVVGEFVDHFTITSTDKADVNSTDVNVTGGTHTGCTVAGHYTSYMVTPDTENYDLESPVTYTFTPNPSVNGTYFMNIALSNAEKVTIRVNNEKVAEKAIGSKFSYAIAAPSGQYLSSATITPAIDFEIVDGKIEFIVPEIDVNIVPEFSDYSYVKISDTTGITVEGLKNGYKAGEKVTLKLSSASAATTIANVTADNAAAVASSNGDGSWTVTIASMPADTTITITPEVDAKFVMDYGMVAIGNFGTGYTSTSHYGTVSMKIGNTALAKGGYAAPTDTVTYTAAPSTNFVFDGWYYDAACTPAKLLSREKTYNVKPKSDTTIYALFVPRHYMSYTNSVNDLHEMDYDPEKRMFTHTSSTISKSAQFRVTNTKDASQWNDGNSYAHFDSSFSVSFNSRGGDMSISWGNDGLWVLNSNSKNYPYTFALTINGNESVDFSATASSGFGDKIYLSAGHLDLETGTYNSSVFDADTTLIESTITLSDKQYVKDGGNTREVYRTGIFTEPQNITFQTVISGSCTEGDIPKYKVANYVVYYIDTGKYDIITPNVVNSTTFQGTAYIDGPCYITPIYFVPDEYADANGLANIDIYFDVAGIQNLKWGPFVACYAWGNNGDYDYLGSWSGQLMIPTKDRKSFYTQLTVPAVDAENPSSVPNGVTFNNYLQATVPGNHAAAFGISSTQYQCYDYREPLTLYEQGYEVITFVVKESKDGYHGDHPNGVTQNKVEKKTYSDLTTRFKFDYLYSRDGETPMDLNGDEIVDYKNINAGEKADYYIVAKGDNRYYKNKHGYAGDPAYEGKWTVEWFVFDNTGKCLTNIISDAFYNEKSEGVTYLLDALGLTAEQVSGKTVAISYELLNNYSVDGASHQLSYDGQWYGNMLDHTVTGNVVVGLRDGDNFEVNVNDPLNEAAYGDAYITDENGDKHQSLLISLDSGEINLTASAKTDSSDPNDVKKYTFDGWYTVDANGDFTKIGDALSVTEYINNNETYYAFFRELGEHAVTITHTAYNNPNDPDIESHGGVGEMYVEVRDKNDNIVSKGLYSTSSSMAEFRADEGETYKITISTTPLMNGQFYAWYTDSFKADSTKTFEEILTEEGHKYSKTKVEATFEYLYDSTDPLLQTNINIYSDIVRVSNKATIKFKYLNRYNNPCTYTIKDIQLTDAECMGYEGNGYNAYVPTYYYYLTLDNDKKIYVEPGTEGNYEYNESENNIQKYVPDENVTEAFNSTIKWVLDKKFITISPSLIEISADQDLPEYTINYSMPGESGSQRGVFNTLMKVSAPSTDKNGKPFSYWYEPATGEILSYSQHYNYKIVENKTIEAVYGEEITQEWTPSINSVTLTREFKDDGDFVYTDYLLAFNNKDCKILTDIYKDENIEYGLLVYRDANYYIEGENNITYPKTPSEMANSNNKVEYYLKEIAKNKKKNMAFPVDATKYNCYYYDLTGNDLTIFNRCDYYVRYHNNYEVAPGKYYRDYALTAVAYIIVDGQVYLSQPKNVNFYELGNMQVRSVN